jgi:hypothetical protein
MIDLLKDEDPVADDNRFRAPLIPNDKTVMMAQYSAILIALVSQDDVVKTIGLISVSYDPKIQATHSSASRFMWVLANTMRFFEGLLTVMVSFTFIVRSNDVLEMFMNFAAVEFISSLDNIVFELVTHGYVGDDVEKKAKGVSDLSFPVTRKHLRWVQRVAFLTILAAMVSGLAVVHHKQANGEFLYDSSCRTLEITFGDATFDLKEPLDVSGTSRNEDRFYFPIESPPALIYSFFSANYVAVIGERNGNSNFEVFNNRPQYYQDGLEGDPTAGFFYYCEDGEAWVFTIPAMKKNIPNATFESCKYGWLMQSPTTEAFSLEDAPLDNWSVWTGTVETTSLSVRCNECYRDSDCGLSNGKCNNDRVCECNDGWEGDHCEQELPFCETMMLTERGDSSLDFQYYSHLDRHDYFDDTEENKIHGRPLYHNYDFSENSVDEDTEGVQVVFYSGSRWLVSVWERGDFFDILEDFSNDLELTTDFIDAYWHMDQANDLYYFSDPDNSFSPAGVASWNYLLGSRSGSISLGASGASFQPFGAFSPVDARYECLDVDVEKNLFCGKNGAANEINDEPSPPCICENAYGGIHCEFAPFESYVYAQAMQFIDEYDETVDSTGEYVFNNYHQLFWAKYTNEELYQILKQILLNLTQSDESAQDQTRRLLPKRSEL